MTQSPADLMERVAAVADEIAKLSNARCPLHRLAHAPSRAWQQYRPAYPHDVVRERGKDQTTRRTAPAI